jgi:hypothetical protein
MKSCFAGREWNMYANIPLKRAIIMPMMVNMTIWKMAPIRGDLVGWGVGCWRRVSRSSSSIELEVRGVGEEDILVSGIEEGEDVITDYSMWELAREVEVLRNDGLNGAKPINPGI